MKYKILSITAAFCGTVSTLWGQATPAPIAQFNFEKNTAGDAEKANGNGFSFSKGLDGFAPRLVIKNTGFFAWLRLSWVYLTFHWLKGVFSQ